MPAQPTKLRTPEPDVEAFAAQVRDTIYAVTYNDASDELLRALTPQQLLDAVRDEVRREANGKLLRELSLVLDTHSGRELVMEAPNERILKVRTYLVGKRIFRLTLVLDADVEYPFTHSRDTRKFFDSFRLH